MTVCSTPSLPCPTRRSLSFCCSSALAPGPITSCASFRLPKPTHSHRRTIPPSPRALPAEEHPFPSQPNSAPASPSPPAASAYDRLMLAARQHIRNPGPTAFPPFTDGSRPRQTGSSTSCAVKCAPSHQLS